MPPYGTHDYGGFRNVLPPGTNGLVGIGRLLGYKTDAVCRAGDQTCSDSIQFHAIGAVTQPLIESVNRPTFQQADEILGHGPR